MLQGKIKRCGHQPFKFLEENGPFFDALPYLAATYQDTSMPLMQEIRRDGIDI
jgi:hypothetical protein